MTNNEAKDFLFGQLIEQAAQEGASLSTLEQQVMGLCGADSDSAGVRGDFDAQPSATISAAKISILLHHAYDRLRKEDRKKAFVWEDAIRALQDGDHYLFSFWELIPRHEIDRHPAWTRRVIDSYLLEAMRNCRTRFGRDGRGAFVKKKKESYPFLQTEPSDAASTLFGTAMAVSKVSRRFYSRSNRQLN